MKLGIANQFWTGLKFFLEVAFLSIVFPEYILVTRILLVHVDVYHLLLDKLWCLNIHRVLIILVLHILLLRSNNLFRASRIICFLVGYYHVVHLLLNSVYICILLLIKTLIRLLVYVLILINNIILLLTWHYWVLLLHEELLMVVTLQI